jgi:hypothetical protein
MARPFDLVEALARTLDIVEDLARTSDSMSRTLEVRVVEPQGQPEDLDDGNEPFYVEETPSVLSSHNVASMDPMSNPDEMTDPDAMSAPEESSTAADNDYQDEFVRPSSGPQQSRSRSPMHSRCSMQSSILWGPDPGDDPNERDHFQDADFEDPHSWQDLGGDFGEGAWDVNESSESQEVTRPGLETSWATRNAQALARRAPPGRNQVHVSMGPADASWDDRSAENVPLEPGEVRRVPQRDLQPGVALAWTGSSQRRPQGIRYGPRGTLIGDDLEDPNNDAPAGNDLPFLPSWRRTPATNGPALLCRLCRKRLVCRGEGGSDVCSCPNGLQGRLNDAMNGVDDDRDDWGDGLPPRPPPPRAAV